MKLKPISKNKKIGIFVGSSPLSPNETKTALNNIKELGYSYESPIPPDSFYDSKEHGFSCASAKERLTSLNNLFLEPSIDIILASRGGYGLHEVLSEIKNTSNIKTKNKALIGFSDITPLLLYISDNYNIPTIHGPVLKNFVNYFSSKDVKDSIDELFTLLTDNTYRQTFECNSLKEGTAKGKVICGNLTMLTSVLGTPFDINYDSKILILEDVGEAPYRIHRALMQLKLAGKLESLAGLVFGKFRGCESEKGLSINECIESFLSSSPSKLTYPILSECDIGHVSYNRPISINCEAKIVKNSLITTESPIE